MGYFVRFWGTRGSIPTPGRTTNKYGGNTSCVEIRIDDSLFVCDGGTGLRELGVDLLRRGITNVTTHFLFSHMHWDHIQGFPFFTPAYIPANTCNIYGTRDGDDRFHRLLSGQMRSDYFPVDFSELRSHILATHLDDGRRPIAGVKVTWFEQRHPGSSYAYCLEKNGVKVVYATDNEIDLTLAKTFDEVQADLELQRPVPQSLVEFVRGADLLIADAQYTDMEYPKHVGWGHPRATTVVDLAVLAGVKQLALFHHDPMHSDPEVDAIVQLCRARARRLGSPVFIFAAREGLELKLD